MGKILEKLMKKYWKNVKNTGKVYEKILEKCKKNWKSQGNSSVQKSGNHSVSLQFNPTLNVGHLAAGYYQKLLVPQVDTIRRKTVRRTLDASLNNCFTFLVGEPLLVVSFLMVCFTEIS